MDVDKMFVHVDRYPMLVCTPYCRDNLDKMAESLNIDKMWFQHDHYRFPKAATKRVLLVAKSVTKKEIKDIINGKDSK